MTRIEHQARIDRPTEEVFDFLADGANNPRWQPPVVATTIVEYHPHGLMRITLPVLALLHPLFAWEASWIDNARKVLCDSATPTLAP